MLKFGRNGFPTVRRPKDRRVPSFALRSACQHTTFVLFQHNKCLSLSPFRHRGRFVFVSLFLISLFLIYNNTNLKKIQDLGKSSNDLLGKDYHFSGTSLEVKTATASDVSFKVDGNRDSKSSFVAGNMEGKYTNKYHGLTLTQAWSTSNVLRTQVELENQIAKGLKIDTTTTLNPDKNSKSVILAAAFKQPGLHTRANLDVFNVRTLPFIFSSPPTDLTTTLSPFHRAPL